MTLAPPDVSPDDLDHWCRRWLSAGVAEPLFTAGHLSRVYGLRLTDGREVVVKVRTDQPRLAGCADVQAALWAARLPCPRPLVGPVPLGAYAAGAETHLPGGDLLGPVDGAAERYAELLARFVALAPTPEAVRPLAPNPPWTAWGREPSGGLWPRPDDRAADLNAHPGPAWLDEVGDRVVRRLREATGPEVVGHSDWEAQNLRWHGDRPVVHDWDSAACAPEAVLVGMAASVWPCGAVPRAATVAESWAFLTAYQQAAGRRFSAAEVEVSWAAGLWVYAFNTKKASLDGHPWLDPEEAAERLALAGA
ncbi:hypothetical protein [Catellatospora tritici]|uniref:hypothetical protein n=1 Tax=Catellatospora tritici TaxID=2851566 RepID=UPI001C2D2869|nr:hypothetical protein [Catellatospora tritici]MBV1854808.1 hypothetical protein [Catellatospora tritici]